jgi:uncharacterized lipoprotein NlpE involved in copper resistance
MKKTVIKTTAILLFLVGCFSCAEEKEQEQKEEEIAFTEYSLAETFCQWTNLDYDNNIIVINSITELENYITCTEGTLPEIDFSKKTLLVASGGGGDIRRIDVKFLKTTNKYIMEATIYEGFAAVILNWSKSIVVPKLPENVQVDLHVQHIAI